MSIFDKLQQGAANAPQAAASSNGGSQPRTFTFGALPESLAQMQSAINAVRTENTSTSGVATVLPSVALSSI